MTEIKPQEKRSSFRRVLANRNLVLLWSGQSLSLLGDTFYMIATPWLVLQLTGDALALGTVMATAGIPRAVFMLVGGAFSDRYPPKVIMLLSDAIRLALEAAMAVLVLTGGIRLWMLYAFSLAFGIVAGFFQPASAAIIPQIVDKEDLAPANSLLQGTAQLSMFVGPALAGGMIALFAESGNAGSLKGTGLAIGVDAISFLVSILTLLAMRNFPHPVQPDSAQNNVLKEIGAGLRHVLGNPAMQVIFIMLVAGNFLFVGPFVVGLPVLCKTTLAGGAAAYGLIEGGYSAGNFGGTLLAGITHMKGARGRWFLGGMFVAFGSVLASFAVLRSTGLGFAMMIAIGIGNGILGIGLFTYLQRITPTEMMGRVMSLVSLAGVGLVPLSQALAGMVIKASLAGMFIGAGSLMAVAGVWAIASREGRNLEQVFA